MKRKELQPSRGWLEEGTLEWLRVPFLRSGQGKERLRLFWIVRLPAFAGRFDCAQGLASGRRNDDKLSRADFTSAALV